MCSILNLEKNDVLKAKECEKNEFEPLKNKILLSWSEIKP